MQAATATVSVARSESSMRIVYSERGADMPALHNFNLRTLICTYTNSIEVAPETLTALIYINFKMHFCN